MSDKVIFTDLGDWKRTHTCGELTASNVGSEVTLFGWASKRRDHGGVIFIDLRDIKGITQVVFRVEIDKTAHHLAEDVRSEFVLAIKGKVVARSEDTINSNLPTGHIEVEVHQLKVLSSAKTPPFALDSDSLNEDVRLKYRYLDLRRPQMQQNIQLRHRVSRFLREYLYNSNFFEIETPFLTKSTPEGARDFVVPSRLNYGTFYALPQSPQLFKQLLMVAGYERYFQIVRCFRDEDLRADRQPEFTQLDIEMSFVNQQDVMNFIEKMIVKLFKEIADVEFNGPLPVMDYYDAMERFGSDAPDTRFEMYLKTITDVVKGSDFKVFEDVISKGGIVKAVKVENFDLSRKDIETLENFVKDLGAKGLAYIKINADGLQSPIVKFLGDERVGNIVKVMDGKVGDIIFFGAGDYDVVNLYMAKLRLRLADMMGLLKKDKFSLVWVVNFPMFEYDADNKRWAAKHHPFTSPVYEDIEKMDSDPKSVRAKAYDLVCNGSEIGGGSIRIHDFNLQQHVFKALGLSDEETKYQFGFFIEALQYGTPPHGGVAFGIDRVVSILAGVNSIREVIAFPKTQKGTDLMCEAPSIIDDSKLKELGVSVIKKK